MNLVDIEGYEGLYKINIFGNIKSFKRSSFGLFIKGRNDGNGYSKVALWKDNMKKEYKIHRLMGQAFLGLDIKNSKKYVLHKKEILINGLLNNSLDNLWLGNAKDNSKDCVKKNRHSSQGKFGKLNPGSKKVNQYDLHGNFIKLWESIADIKRGLKISDTSISLCCKGKLKTAGGFTWHYVKEKKFISLNK